jgi:hypothetical protein
MQLKLPVVRHQADNERHHAVKHPCLPAPAVLRHRSQDATTGNGSLGAFAWVSTSAWFKPACDTHSAPTPLKQKLNGVLPPAELGAMI